MSSISNQSFVDGIGDVRLRDGIVRMDLLALSPTRRDADGNPVPEFTEQLVMSPAAFGRMVTALGQTVNKLKDQGLLQATSKAAPETGPDKASSAESSSPNF